MHRRVCAFKDRVNIFGSALPGGTKYELLMPLLISTGIRNMYQDMLLFKAEGLGGDNFALIFRAVFRSLPPLHVEIEGSTFAQR